MTARALCSARAKLKISDRILAQACPFRPGARLGFRYPTSRVWFHGPVECVEGEHIYIWSQPVNWTLSPACISMKRLGRER